MAASKFLFLSLLLLCALILGTVRAEEDVAANIEETRTDDALPAKIKIEIELLKSRIQLLEKNIEESSSILKSKDESIANLERAIQVKSDIVAALQSEIRLIQKKGTSDAEELVGKAHARAAELQKQVESLKEDIEVQIKDKNALAIRAKEAEKKIEELTFQVENLQKVNDEQKVKISKTERALQVAEEELMKAKFEATSRTKELLEVHGAWLPPWLAEHAIRLEALIKTEWDEHGRPVMEILSQRVLEINSQSKKWAEPHIETMKTKWIPAAKEHWVTVVEYVGPHIQTLNTRASEVYESSKDAIKPHIVKIQEVANPYYQEVRKFSKPYVDQVAIVAKPHVEKARIAVKPYTKKTVHAYRKFLESATTYHNQLQDAVHEKLKNNEITKPLATKELVWFVASALLALPVIVLSRTFSSTFGKKSKKPSRGSDKVHHARRKGKRLHSDKQ